MRKINKINKDKNKYVVIFCVKESNAYNFIKMIAVKPTTTSVNYDKDKPFLLDIEHHTYRKNNVRYYCIDINSQQIYFEQLKDADFITSKITKRLITDEIIMQLAKATTTPIKQTYDYKSLIIGLIIGSLIGFILKIFIPIG